MQLRRWFRGGGVRRMGFVLRDPVGQSLRSESRRIRLIAPVRGFLMPFRLRGGRPHPERVRGRWASEPAFNAEKPRMPLVFAAEDCLSHLQAAATSSAHLQCLSSSPALREIPKRSPSATAFRSRPLPHFHGVTP